jgi:hypothetical protein
MLRYSYSSVSPEHCPNCGGTGDPGKFFATSILKFVLVVAGLIGLFHLSMKWVVWAN